MPDVLRIDSVLLLDAGINRDDVTTVIDTENGLQARGRIIVTLAHPQSDTVIATRQTIRDTAENTRLGDDARDAQTYPALDDCSAGLASVDKKAREAARGITHQLATLVGSTLQASQTDVMLEHARLPDGVLCGAQTIPQPSDRPAADEPEMSGIVRMSATIETASLGTQAHAVPGADTALGRFVRLAADPPPLGLLDARYAVPANGRLAFTVGSASRAVAQASGMHPYPLALRIAALRASAAAGDIGSALGSPQLIVAYPAGSDGEVLVGAAFTSHVIAPAPQWARPPGPQPPAILSGAGIHRDTIFDFQGRDETLPASAYVAADEEQVAVTATAGANPFDAHRASAALERAAREAGADCCYGLVYNDPDSVRLVMTLGAPTVERNERLAEAIRKEAALLGAGVEVAARLALSDCLVADRAIRRRAFSLMSPEPPLDTAIATPLAQGFAYVTGGTCGIPLNAAALASDTSGWPDMNGRTFDAKAPTVLTAAGRVTIVR